MTDDRLPLERGFREAARIYLWRLAVLLAIWVALALLYFGAIAALLQGVRTP